ncbi:hypothetical protein [Rosistilla oblonga]|uniref:Uncharacterized protein n=1 Tax=Rosistilla oblonga TaxID=2527990 RepID=A0A518ITS1_9BACT|nr:hypothetical protein [Rosistilla oblonga]QDV56487.1 hypothetical protein Mal33_24780 [Rosistilla oblonga]
MASAIANSIPDLIRIAESQFRMRATSFDHFRPHFLHDDVTVHAFRRSGNDDHLDDHTYDGLRDWFENQGWIVSRQRFRKPPFDGVEHIYIAPIETLHPSVAFHATRTVSIKSIENNGLCPGLRERCNTERLDSIGNIYAASKLGSPGDESRNNFGTAHWWREHLAHENRFDDPVWSILQIDVAAVGGLTCFRDIWSRTGIVIRANVPIDGRFVKTVA